MNAALEVGQFFGDLQFMSGGVSLAVLQRLQSHPRIMFLTLREVDAPQCAGQLESVSSREPTDKANMELPVPVSLPLEMCGPELSNVLRRRWARGR